MKISRLIRHASTIILTAGLTAALAGLIGFEWAVHGDSGKAFTKEGIRQILAVESTVYFSDGKTKVGTFFEGQHRDYVPYDSIPPMIVDALVAAEDHNYWTHKGVDPKALFYAALDDIKAGSLRRGGSTLTQQTAKILFNRKGRTFSAKLGELVNAYRLEKNFTKQEILEFYLNQFYVSSNGHGVRIAARYFFDKELKDLDLVECAFIAGSVKGPNQYNPFIQESAKRREEALRRAQARVGYVLKQLYRMKKITAAQYQAAAREPVPFRRGTFQYALSTNMVKAKRLLESAPVQKALKEHDIDDFMAEGLQIYTTLDAGLQRAAEYATYANLSRLQLIFQGYRPPRDTQEDLVNHFEPGRFYTGRIVALSSSRGQPNGIQVRFGASKAWVRAPALGEFFRGWNQHEQGAAAEPAAAVEAKLVRKLFPVGGALFCSVPLGDSAPGPEGPSLRIEQKPAIQGATVILKDGKVLANVGGFENTGYDRVNQAKRQFGSAFKPLVYAAALELGWKPLDPLPNRRQVFRLGNLFYLPKPDHPPEDTVSIAWAARRSENIASVYLLFHLFDKTEFADFWEAGRAAGFSPEDFPSQEAFEAHVRDTLGLVLDEAKMREVAYQKAVAALAPDLIFEGRVREAEILRATPYGAGFEREAAGKPERDDAEEALKRRLLKRNFLAYLAEAKAWSAKDYSAGQPVLAKSKATGQLGWFRSAPDTGWGSTGFFDNFTSGDSILVEGELSVGTLKRVEAKMEASPAEGPRYTRENLYASPDFRALAALQYIVWFGHRLGIRSRLDPVISFPLGVNVITLGEAANVYQSIQGGAAYRTQAGDNQLFIQRIATRDGAVIWEDKAEPVQVLSERCRQGMEGVLATVVEGGTGRQIGQELKVAGPGGAQAAIPAFGKTGTTNDYRNAAFLGFVSGPAADGKAFSGRDGYAIGTYVGFDDNASMVHKGFKGTGANVAVPAWLALAKSLAADEDYAAHVDFADAAVQAAGRAPLYEAEKYARFVVSRRTGLPLPGGDGGYLRADSTAGGAEDLSEEADEGRADSRPTSPAGYATILIREQ